MTPAQGGSASARPPTDSRYAEPPLGVSPGVPAAVPPTPPQVPYVPAGTAAAPWPARASDASGVVPPGRDAAAAPRPAPHLQPAAPPQDSGPATAVPDFVQQYADYYRQRYGLDVPPAAAASAQRAPSGAQPPADPSVTPGSPAATAADASFSGANAAPGRRDYSTLAADAVVESAAPAAELDLQREGDQIVAVIGPEVVLLSEVLPAANRYLEQNADRIPSGYMEEMRRAVVQQLAERLIQTKLILVDFRQTVPEENQKRIRQQFERLFDEEEVPRLMQEHEITTRSQLEQKLRESGVTLDQLRREFVDRTLAQQWVREQVGSNAEITHEEMLAWYVAHLDDYRYPAKVRWQQLTVHARDGRTKAEAYARLAELGNRVLAGEPFEQVAREASEGLTADDGGVNDWTSQGSLVCEDLDRALFSLPVGAMSRIIEDGDAFHIVRVLQRQEAGRVPFRDAQVEIKKNLQRERMEKRYNDYLARLRARTRVWTAFERPATGVADNTATSQR